ncbi:hypothetical protein MA5S0422_2424 [Mycobacteroides abscessus 5S-0422]|uniref:Uncharacterized protein n=1 Tax=Mycobacteroides abscessus subsp. bolletii 1513 TaxID=1299321 RepID=X8DR98_9MYCO|nr:hypothetical protein MA5S0304_1492 [Mycobacteroides abscessus 5S-0304]EIU14304.1 hypothetical protein MA5S0421_1743 [Mycobacteroides abscessus 5S-0421]EIU14884.1 hypothetical protein MA5S0422_2424 [Mycobacteroides abscessus 5S-0422]EIU27076.1 hypothetical protein MA5S0708_1967 [Mycobacteroides abscessus 5S-0708]EIU27415.1 hypothetical protein MA5S0817_1523 [Mycobacteroides abscessus 5S-0817]EIU30406.1 hypothetical protein MA5S1212_4932 [Mycobacteroides abscessus 5S-1212]EIU49885.1 hypothet
MVAGGPDFDGLISIFERVPVPDGMVRLFTWWTCDVELDCSSVVLPHWLHQMQDMCS